MTLKQHSIFKDFPEMHEHIHEIKKNDSHFASMSDKYDELEQAIHSMESGEQAYTDEHLEELKKKRLKLKDELFSLLQKKAS
jgi:uncharacterized protein YdcH (DUF465 family)